MAFVSKDFHIFTRIMLHPTHFCIPVTFNPYVCLTFHLVEWLFLVWYLLSQFFLSESANSQVLLGLKAPSYYFHVACDHKRYPCFLCVLKSISFCFSKLVMYLGGKKLTVYMLDYKEFKL